MLKPYFMSLLKQNIRHARLIHDKSQEQVAFDADINPAYYGQIERGLKCPTIYTLYRIAYVLDTTVEELCRFEIEPYSGEEETAELLIRDIPRSKLDEFTRAIQSIKNLM